MATPANVIDEVQIQRTIEALRRLWRMRPDVAATHCEGIIEYESALRCDRTSMGCRLRWLKYLNHLVGGTAGTDDTDT